MLRSAKLSGTVIARVAVDRRGTVTNVTFDSTQRAHDLFRASARNALRRIKFAPAKRLGIARAGARTYSIEYVLGEIDPGHQVPQPAGADSVPGCPVSRDETRLVVCGVPHVVRVDMH